MLKGDDYGGRIVLDTTFEAGLVATTDALLLAGFQIAARVDVREALRPTLHHDCRRYTLLVVYAPETMLRVLLLDLAAGPALPVTVAVYELVDGEVAVVIPPPFEGAVERSQLAKSATGAGSMRRRRSRAPDAGGRLSDTNHAKAGEPLSHIASLVFVRAR